MGVAWWLDRGRLNREIGVIRTRHARHTYKREMAELEKMVADGEKEGAESKAAFARQIEASRGQSEGPVRGYDLLAPIPPEK